jgi:hypothetical protein
MKLVLSVRTAICWLGVVVISSVLAEPLVAQHPVIDSDVCVTTWKVKCDGVAVSGHGASGECQTAAEAETEAYTLAEQHASANCGPEQSYSIELVTMCLPGTSDPTIRQQATPSAPSTASAPMWTVKYSCVGCTGRTLSLTRSGKTFCEAYRAAKASVHEFIQRPAYGGAKPCSCRYQILQRPACSCCCHRCRITYRRR